MIVKDQASNRRTSIVLAIVLGVLQLAVVPNIAILGGHANLALVFVACACLGGDAQAAPVLGFFSGLFYDLSGSGPIGLMALLLTIVAWLLAASGRSQVADDLASSVVLFAPVAFAVAAIYALILLATGMSSSFVDAVLMRALPGAVLDIVSLWLVGLVLSRTGGSGSGGLSLGGKGRQTGPYKMKRGL